MASECEAKSAGGGCGLTRFLMLVGRPAAASASRVVLVVDEFLAGPAEITTTQTG